MTSVAITQFYRDSTKVAIKKWAWLCYNRTWFNRPTHAKKKNLLTHATGKKKTVFKYTRKMYKNIFSREIREKG